jgi:RNA polymerase sigma-70 factor (ECF subfamily)
MEVAIPSYRVFMLEHDRLRQLIREAKAGRIESFEHLVVLHERRVLRLAERLLLNREAARDAAQEVFFRLYKKIQSIKDDGDLAPWLYRTTLNICFDSLRKSKRETALDLVPEPPAGNDDPEQSTASLQQKRLALTALQELSPRERQVIVLRELEGYSTAEVARLLDSTETTVRSQVSTARVKMKNFVAGKLRRPR